MIGEGGKERRERVNFDGIIDALSTAEGGTYLSLCYISGANIGKTLTGKNIDIDKFGNDIEKYQRHGTRGYDMLKNFHQGGASRKNTLPVGLVKRSVIKFHWQTEDKYGEAYGKYKDSANALLNPYGVEIGSREEKHDEKQNFGTGNVSVGATDNTRGRLYSHQNGATVDSWDSSYYMIDKGKIYGGINKNALESLVKKSDPDGVSALRKIGVQEEEIKKYIEQLKKLNFSVIKLMYDRILWVSCTIDGVKKFAINHQFTDKIGDVDINPNIFLKLANNRYDAMYNPLVGSKANNPVVHANQKKYLDVYGESRKRNGKSLRLTESELKQVVKEAATKIITEMAADPTIKIQQLIQQANDAYHHALEVQGESERWPLMDKEGTPYGLTGDIKLNGRGYIIIPFNGAYGMYTPEKIKVLTRAGGRIRIYPGDYMDNGWKDAAKMLKQIIRDAQIGIEYFVNYDPNWDYSETPEQNKEYREALRKMNKQIGRKASAGMDYLSKGY